MIWTTNKTNGILRIGKHVFILSYRLSNSELYAQNMIWSQICYLLMKTTKPSQLPPFVIPISEKRVKTHSLTLGNYFSYSSIELLIHLKPFYRRHSCYEAKICTVYPKKYAHGFCFAVLCCGYTLTDFPISIRLTSLALWQSNDCPSASKATFVHTSCSNRHPIHSPCGLPMKY